MSDIDRQLLDAAWFGNLARVEQALQNGANLEATSYINTGKTPLHLAYHQGHLAVVEELVARGANLEATDNLGRTPLNWVCLLGNLAVVQDLVCRGANQEAADNWGRTPLHLACVQGNLAVVQELVARGANLEARDDDGKTPLHLACEWRHLAVAQELVARGADLFIAAGDGTTAFDLASQCHRSNIVDYLLHAFTDKVSARDGLQAIHSILQSATFLAAHPPWALSLQVQLPLGKLTLDHFQSLLQLFPANSFHSRDNEGDLPLHVACRVGAPIEILRLLVQKYAAALQTTDNNGSLPLHAACQANAPPLESIRFVYCFVLTVILQWQRS